MTRYALSIVTLPHAIPHSQQSGMISCYPLSFRTSLIAVMYYQLLPSLFPYLTHSSQVLSIVTLPPSE